MYGSAEEEKKMKVLNKATNPRRDKVESDMDIMDIRGKKSLIMITIAVIMLIK